MKTLRPLSKAPPGTLLAWHIRRALGYNSSSSTSDPAVGSVMAQVIEVRNREAGGGDTSSGYDLIVTMRRTGPGGWAITQAEKQEICSRGVSTTGGQWLCV